MIYAFYRILYGEDFIKESLESILPHVDKVFIFWTDKFFGDVTEVGYRGEIIQLPKKVDNVIEIIKGLKNPKIELIYDHRPNNKNHFTERVNKYILPHHPKPKYILFMEPDFIYCDAEINLALIEMELLIDEGYYWFSTSQVEYWKTPRYLALRTSDRLAAIWWYLGNIDKIPPTGFHADLPWPFGLEFSYLESRVFNLGFCVCDGTMYWKHLSSMAYAKLIGDSAPIESWYKDKWLNWKFDHYAKSFGISKGFPMEIPYIGLNDELQLLELSESLLKRFQIDI
tara:strand:- start:3020 stop:3871 length:852 start_codon:yes stop_codon:yes gene_type:complete